MSSRSLKASCWAVLLFASGGCASSREAAGEEPPAPSPLIGIDELNQVEPLCADGSTREIALDEVIDNGFSAQDILAFAEGVHDERIRWQPPDGAAISPERGEHALRVTVERASDRAADIEPEVAVIGHGASCSHWLAIPVTVGLQSDGGALNDAISGTLLATHERVAYFRATSIGDELAGELSVSPPREDVYLSIFELAITFSEQGASGTLAAQWRLRDDPALEVEFEPLASFGRATCEPADYAVTLDEVVPLAEDDAGMSAREALEVLSELDTLALAWQSGEQTTATLSFTPGSEGACVFVSPVSPELFATLSVPGQLRFETADGKVDATWPAELKRAGRSSSLSLTLDPAGLPDGSTATAEELGFPTHDRGTLIALNVALYLSLELESGEASGALDLGGFHCGTGSPETSCMYTSVDLDSATLGR